MAKPALKEISVMTISASYLVHFTGTLENLKGILESGFMANLCEEQIIFKEHVTSFFVPMVSFCDIPLSKISKHAEEYGKYGIGMTKTWGESNKINPIIYLKRGSLLSSALQASIKSSIETINKLSDSKSEISEEDLISSRITSFIKNYDADNKSGRYHKGYKFYDEKEWRFVPSETNDNIPILPHYFADMTTDKLANEIRKIKLGFDPKDVRYIVVEKEDEIIEMIKIIRNSKKHYNYNDNEISILSSRIITYEQIVSDI